MKMETLTKEPITDYITPAYNTSRTTPPGRVRKRPVIPPPGEPLLDDRRDALRQKCKAKSLIIESSSGQLIECPVADISRKGLRLMMPVCLPCGSEILIHPPQGVELRVGRARIRRQQVVERNGETWFECGVQFTEQAELRRHTWFLAMRNE